MGFDINFGDINNDGVRELVVSGINIPKTNGTTNVYQWEDGSLESVWDFRVDSGAFCSTADFGDINGDGKDEVVAGTRQNGAKDGGDVFLLDGETSEIIWQFNTGSNNVYDIACGDIRFDGRDEIAVAVGGSLNYTFILEG